MTRQRQRHVKTQLQQGCGALKPLRKMSGSHRSEVVAYTPEGSMPKMRKRGVLYFAKEHRVWLVVI
ncbi:MAG: hypothetical protein MJZ76_06715 [Bacteroidales bacterium]|nr:hypothetical protein [Bacteroidales bacterium]